MLASYALCREVGIPTADFQRAQDAFNPRNGRLQRYRLGGRDVLLNLAKNPTGFNQNLKIVEADRGPKMVAFFINDQVADGRDISWIWDIDFEELAGQPGTVVFAGGSRAHDLAVRLKYAGIEAAVIENIEDAFSRLGALVAAGTLPADAAVYAIANYTALPPVHAALNAMEAAEPAVAPAPTPAPIAEAAGASAAPTSCHPERSAEGAEPKDPATSEPSATPASLASEESPEPPVVIAHMLPDLLNLYGDGGNVRILEQRLRWRGIPVEVRRIQPRRGGGLLPASTSSSWAAAPTASRSSRSEQLLAMRDELAVYVEGRRPAARHLRRLPDSRPPVAAGATSSCPASASSTWSTAPARQHLPTVSSTTWCWNLAAGHAPRRGL